MRSIPAKKHRWTIHGRIVGENLPVAPVTIGNVEIGPLPDGRSVKEPPTVTGITWGGKNEHYWFIPKVHIKVHSTVYFKVSVEAVSKHEAIETATARDIGPLQVALSLLGTKHPYQIELLVPRPLKMVVPYEPKELDIELVRRCQTLYSAIRYDETAMLAAAHLRAAILQSALATDEYNEDAALLGYFKVIETLAHKVIDNMSFKSAFSDERVKIVAVLGRKLDSPKSTMKKCAAIEEAQKALARLEARFLGIKIERTAEALDMPSAWREQAIEFNRLRNQKLSHGGQSLSKALRKRWLKGEGNQMSAFQIARDILTAYIDVRLMARK